MATAWIAENREDCSFIWENYFDPKGGINEYDLTVFVKNRERSERGQELFSRFPGGAFPAGIYIRRNKIAAGGRAGLSFVRAYDADTLGK